MEEIEDKKKTATEAMTHRENVVELVRSALG